VAFSRASQIRTLSATLPSDPAAIYYAPVRCYTFHTRQLPCLTHPINQKMNAISASRPVVSDYNHGPEVSIVTLFLTVLSVLALIGRLATKFTVTHRFDFDDPLLSIALVGKCPVNAQLGLTEGDIAFYHRQRRLNEYSSIEWSGLPH
jgi:hypothetical protein